MTDRLKGVLVTFKRDIREDDAESIINAIQMVKGVMSVKPVPSNFDTHMAEERVRREIYDKIFKLVYPELDKP